MNKEEEKELKKVNKAINKLYKVMYGKEYKSIGLSSIKSVPKYAHSIDKGMVRLSNDVSVSFTVVEIKDK
jgi:hypothetical protein